MAGFLADKGLRILRNGYTVIPITPGKKYPDHENDWRTIQTTAADIQRWLRNGFAEGGVGIRTGKAVFIDMDIYDPEIAVEMQDWTELHIGLAPVRIGNAPKRGMLYRTATPFRKLSSKKYVDPQDRENHVEVLGEGQQFVSHHIHPDTGKPYLWVGKNDNPEFVPIDDLPEITEDQARAIIARFEVVANAEPDWTRKHSTPALTAPSNYGVSEIDDLGYGTDPLGLSDEELRAKVMAIPNDSWPYGDDGDTETIGWFKIMSAIAHETGKSDFGEALAYEWSVQAANKHTDERFNKTWISLGKTDRRPITGRYILRWAKVYERLKQTENLAELTRKMDTAGSIDALKTIARDAQKIELDRLDRTQLTNSLQVNAKRFGVPIGIRDARGMLRYDPDTPKMPSWLDGWTFLTHSNRFYNRKTGAHIEAAAFNAAYGRKVDPETVASRYALNTVKIPIFHMAMYLPREEDTFTDAVGLVWANTYIDTSPKVPDSLTDRDRANLKVVQNHGRHLFGGNTRDYELLISTLAYVVQTGKRVNYMTIVQGAEGIGKTYYAGLMAAVLGGSPHVYKLDTKTLTESPFTEWAEGHQITFIEELKIHGKSYDVMNMLKTYITDETISIHPKNFRQYNAVNTTTYLAFTNFRDALPLGKSDTRYFVILSQWEDQDKADAFKVANPDYYPALFRALEESPGALRGWLLNYPLHPEFNPMARAPQSEGRQTMISEGRSDLEVTVEDIIKSGEIPGVSSEFLIVHKLRIAAIDDERMLPDHRAVIAVLKKMNFAPVACRQVKISAPYEDPQKNYRIWSKNPEIRRLSADKLREMVIQTVFFDGL